MLGEGGDPDVKEVNAHPLVLKNLKKDGIIYRQKKRSRWIKKRKKKKITNLQSSVIAGLSGV